MKTLYYQFSEIGPANEMVVTGETKNSYVITFVDAVTTAELCVDKSKEGEQWFRTLEEAEAAFEKKREVLNKIEELKKLL